MKQINEDGRKPVTRLLPPLAEYRATFSGFKGNENRTDRLFEVLTVLIQRSRQAKPQPFYAMREVATHFNVSLNTVARAYRRLAREGVLTLVRGSQSIIN